MNKITINHGSFKLDDIELEHGTLTVGRAADNDVQLDDAAVSSHHAKIVTFFNVSYIEDLDSTNGTIVNGKKIKKYTLHTGDILILGKHQLLFTGSKVHQGHETADSTIMMTQADLNSALTMASENNARENESPSQRAPSTQNIGSIPAVEPQKAVTPPHQVASRNQATPISTAQKTPSHETRTTQARVNPAARPIHPSHRPIEAPIAARVKATSDMSFSTANADDDEPLEEIFKDFVAPPRRAATPSTTKHATTARPTTQQQVSNKTNSTVNSETFAPVRVQASGNTNQRRSTEKENPARTASIAPQNAAANNGGMDVQAVKSPETNAPPPPSAKRRIVVEDPSVLAGDPGRIYNVSSGISETDRSAEYLSRAFGAKGGRQEMPAVGDKTLLRQIITGDRDFSPSRNKFEIIQIVLGFLIFAILAFIAFSNY